MFKTSKNLDSEENIRLEKFEHLDPFEPYLPQTSSRAKRDAPPACRLVCTIRTSRYIQPIEQARPLLILEVLLDASTL